MSRVFLYARVSTADQTTDNQVREVAAAGFAVTPLRTVCETVSGAQAAMERPGFTKLLERMEPGDVLVVTKLDRLGRNAMDVRSTVDTLAAASIKVHCLALGGVDLTSPAGRMTMGVIAAVAEFERDLIVERTQAGLERAKAAGVALGRPATFTDDQIERIRTRLVDGRTTVSALAREMGTSRQTIMRARDAVTT